jgi:HlyD family secretion protein
VNHGRRFPHWLALQAPGVPDADLLARWVAGRDEAAFELLVRRHAPTVLAACRRLLADPNDADDAFQAVFLVLARKAASVARGEVLGAWLHRVACRAALRIRADRARRTDRHEPGAVELLPDPAPADPAWAELLRVLDEEVERLPARHRAVFVLCCLEGKTGEEAGKLLGCPPGTVSSRLTRARERLRARLTRRGFAPAALVLAALTGDALAAPVPDAVVEAVIRAAPPFAARLQGAPPTRSTALAEGVVRAMFANKLKLVPALLVIGLLAVGAVLAGSDPDRDNRRAADRPVPNAAPDEKGRPDEKAPPAALRVRLVKPQRGGLDRIATQQCVAEAGRKAHLFPVTAGVVARVEARIGDSVKAGQLLAEIDAPGLILDERLAALGVEQAQGLFREAEARDAAAKAELDAAKGVARLRQTEVVGAKANVELKKRAFERIKALAKQGTIGQQEVDEAEEKFRAAEGLMDVAAVGADNAKADRVVKEAKLMQAEAGVTTAKANIEAAKLGLEKARLAVAQTRIIAPFDGVVAAVDAAPGQFVRAPGERADPVPLVTLMRPDFLRLVVWVPERDAVRVAPGLAAEVTFDALPGVVATGKVARVGLAVEPPHRAVRAEIDLPNTKGEVRPGMTGSVTLNFGKGPADALRVPLGAVVNVVAAAPGAPETAVYVYKEGKARLTPVRLGHRDGKEAEVLSGLTGEDLVVADPKGLAPRVEVAVEIEKPAPPK